MKNLSSHLEALCQVPSEIENEETARIIYLRTISYGIVMPIIGSFGVIGNVLNLVVLTRRDMRGTAYVYMRAHSLSSLLAILFCIPFALRVLLHDEAGAWTSWPRSFYHAHLELYLTNGCIGLSAMMLSALTLERHASVCGPRLPARSRPALTAALLAMATFLLYLPSCLGARLQRCRPTAEARVLVYRRRDNAALLHSRAYQLYRLLLELLFKAGPALLMAALNLRILLARRRSRRRVGRAAEERRLALLLASSSLLFFVCAGPMLALNLTLSERRLARLSYQLFRALANLLELTHCSLAFYVHCLFSRHFRDTFMRTFGLRRPGPPCATTPVAVVPSL